MWVLKFNKKEEEAEKRVFLRPASIYKQLFCSACHEVFFDPVMGNCQHTFCRKCLISWIENREQPACPICREKLPRSNKLRKNLLANQLISGMEVRCSNRACKWTGQLEALKSHLPTCEYREGNLPDWFKEYVKSCEDEIE